MSGAQRRRRRRPNTRNRSQPREERELRPRCITHLCARARARRIVDINRQRMHRDQRSCACWRIVARVFFSRRRRSSLEKSFESPPLVLIVIRAMKKWGLCQFEKIEKGKNTNNLSLTDTKYDIHIQRVISRYSGHYRESPTRASIYRRNNSSENSPRIGCINHFVGHRSDHVVAPFPRLDSAPPDRTPRFFSRSTNFRCIGLKISLIFAVSLKKILMSNFFFFSKYR